MIEDIRRLADRSPYEDYVCVYCRNGSPLHFEGCPVSAVPGIVATLELIEGLGGLTSMQGSIREQVREGWARLETTGMKGLIYVRIPVPAKALTLADVPHIPESISTEIGWIDDMVTLTFYKRVKESEA